MTRMERIFISMREIREIYGIDRDYSLEIRFSQSESLRKTF